MKSSYTVASVLCAVLAAMLAVYHSTKIPITPFERAVVVLLLFILSFLIEIAGRLNK